MQGQVPPCSAALGTLARPRTAGARWRVDTAQSTLERRTDWGYPLSASHCPLELAEILRSALQLLCHGQVQHAKHITTSAHRDGTTTNEHSAACTQCAARARC